MELKQPFKILYVHQDGLISGSFLSLTYLIKGLSRELFTPEVIFLANGPAVEEMSKLGIKTYVCKSATFWTYPGPRFLSKGNLNNYKALIPNLALRALIKQVSPDIIHINDKAALCVGVSTLGLKIPIVQHIRSTFYIINAKINTFIQTSLIGIYANKIIGITEAETKEFEKYHACMVYNSLDLVEVDEAIKATANTKTNLELNSEYLNIGWVAKFNKQKGVWDFLDLAQKIAEEYPELKIKFYMVGKLPDENQQEFDLKTKQLFSVKNRLQSYLDNTTLKDKLVLLGYRNDYLKIMAALDVVVNCNRLGSMGRQAFETMAVNTISISTHRHPEITKMITNGLNGYIVKEGDIDNTMNIILDLYHHRNKLNDISYTAGQHARNEFDNNLQTKKIEQHYLNLLSNER